MNTRRVLSASSSSRRRDGLLVTFVLTMAALASAAEAPERLGRISSNAPVHLRVCLLILPDSQAAVALMTNTEGARLGGLAWQLAAIAGGR